MSDSDDSYTPEVPTTAPAAPPVVKKVVVQSPEPESATESSKTPEPEIVNDNEDNEYDPEGMTENTNETGVVSIREINEKIDVNLFNAIVTFFLTSPLKDEPAFEALNPNDKSTVVLQAYNTAHDTSITQEQINLNFAATTSYNKNKLRPRDEPQPTVPINPYCHRRDISKPMSSEEYQQWQDFLSKEDKYSKEYNCMGFPSGSRMFVGNLAVNTLKQKDVWRVFRPYGDIAAVNMKQGFGFVQFTDDINCREAIRGEIHVPLHNRTMELQVSKTHERHKEMKEEGLDPVKADHKQQVQPQQPQQAQAQQQQPTKPIKSEILLLLTPDPSPTFNSMLVNTLQESDIDCQIKHVDTDADNIDQEIISQAAYGGKTGIVITRVDDVVDLMLFSKEEAKPEESEDTSGEKGAIRFDNYESISMESAVGWINEHVKKINAKIKASQPKQRDTRGNKGRHDNANNKRNYRDRDDNRRQYDDRERPARESNRNTNHRNQGGNRRHNHYSESEQYNQKHKPVSTPGYQGHQQHQAPVQQGYYAPPPQGYGGYPPSGYYPPPQPYYNHQQGYYPPQGPYGNIYAQPPYGAQYPNQPGGLPGMTSNAMPPPAVGNGNNVMGGLLSQLQNGPPAQAGAPNSAAPAPAPAPTPAQPAKSQDDTTAALFETLARLKNNM